MQRRSFLLGLGTAAAVGAGGAYYTGTIGGGPGGDDPMTDGGGLTGFDRLERVEWGRFGEVTLTFADDHGSDFFTISHGLNADAPDTYVLARESPDFGGEVVVDFGAAIEDDGRDFPSREYAIDYYTGTLTSVVGSIDEHLGTDRFSVPEKVTLTGGTELSG
jgi:hypothetical protein